MKIKILSENDEVIETYLFTDIECNALKKIMDIITEKVNY